MNWMVSLAHTYDKVLPNISEYSLDDIPLTPICHKTNLASVEIILDEKSNFIGARVIGKKGATTIIPCTNESDIRSGKVCSPHPLCDKLEYIASDYEKYASSEIYPSKKNAYSRYIKLLDDWCSSDFSLKKIRIIRDYVSRGTLITDLVNFNIVVLDEDGKFATKNSNPDALIFKIIEDQGDIFVRWEVQITGDFNGDTWLDCEIQNSWKEYYMSTLKDVGICSITGEETILSLKHPSKIRNSVDKAKIISSDDKNGFSFRGRFNRAEQSCSIGYVLTQKAHCALRWLIGNQGYSNEGLTIVSWTIDDKDVPNFMDNDLFLNIKDTGLDASRSLNNLIKGYYGKIDDLDNIVIMVLNSASDGRLAILRYEELNGSEFVNKILKWHYECEWIHRYVQKKDTYGKKHNIVFTGAPTPRDIVLAAYGERVEKELMNRIIFKLYLCIIDNRRIPKDVIESIIKRVLNPTAISKLEWEKVISIACSVYKRENIKEGYSMALDEKRCTRDYLYGRLLAIAYCLEKKALDKAEEKRQTNAERLMRRFRDYPCETWTNIELSLNTSSLRLKDESECYKELISKITSMFNVDDFTNRKKLSGEFILGFHSQCEVLREKDLGKDTKEE